MSALAEAADVDQLEQAITLAIADRRPQLAARLVGLLPPDHPGDEAIQTAQRAAKWLLVTQGPEIERAFSELEEAWRRLRKQRMKRIKERMRKSLAGRTDRTKRLDKRRR